MKEHVISRVEAGSIAEETGIEAGDVLLAIDGKEIRDIFDYRMLCQQEEIVVLIRKGAAAQELSADAAGEDTASAQGEEWELEIEKDAYEDIGLVFASGLMDRYRSCCNGCIFCFIDQMPKGMRDTLYFKDDDARLSFLQGNYVTLTNMTDLEIDRILEYHLSPINVSFHTTNPELRVRMLKNKRAGEALEKAKRLAAAGTGIELNGQIVLCKGWNDKEELDRTLHDLFYDYAPGLRSVSVVPVGLTRHREGLAALQPFTPEDAKQVLSQIHAFQEEAVRVRGSRFVYAGDEWYLLAHRAEVEKGAPPGLTAPVDKVLPKAEAYEDYPQLENGVGMTRLMIDEFREALSILTGQVSGNGAGADSITIDLRIFSNEISFCCGMLSYPIMRYLFDEASALCPGLTVHLYPVRNDFFGEMITVSGLLTGGDLISQLKGKRFGKKLYLPGSCLRAGEEVLLDDVTVSDLTKALGTEVAAGGHSGYDLVTELFDLQDGALSSSLFAAERNPYELKDGADA